MAIGIIFEFGSEIIEVRIIGTNCLFKTKDFGGASYPIDNLRLEKTGVIKEFPDLKDKDDWREQAIKRFKEKLKNMKTEQERIDYVKEDLKKYGYRPKYIQRDGHRVQKIRE